MNGVWAARSPVQNANLFFMNTFRINAETNKLK